MGEKKKKSNSKKTVSSSKQITSKVEKEKIIQLLQQIHFFRFYGQRKGKKFGKMVSKEASCR